MSTCISDVYLHAITQGNFSNGQRGGGEGTLHIKGTLVYTGEWRNGETLSHTEELIRVLEVNVANGDGLPHG